MKTLLILRHAKSSWDNPDIADFDRPLNSRGLEAMPVMGGVLFKNNLQPQKILSSPAKRAKQTAILIKETAQIEGKITYVEGIYEASPLRLLNIVSEVEDKVESVLLVGHNPGLEGFVKMLTRESYELPTATIVKIDLDIESWHDITVNRGKVSLYVRPKDKMKDAVTF
jgi:phosphohistidine phosphatase